MICTTLTGKRVEIRPGQAMTGHAFTRVEITAADLELLCTPQGQGWVNYNLMPRLVPEGKR